MLGTGIFVSTVLFTQNSSTHVASLDQLMYGSAALLLTLSPSQAKINVINYLNSYSIYIATKFGPHYNPVLRNYYRIHQLFNSFDVQSVNNLGTFSSIFSPSKAYQRKRGK